MSGKGLTGELVFEHGVPHLSINGQKKLPFIFFFNNEVPRGQHHLRPQVELSAKAAVHIYSLVLPWPWPGETQDYSEGERILDQFIAADPQALFIPRIRCEGSAAWQKAHPEACVQFPNGNLGEMTSLSSDLWFAELEAGLTAMIRHYENSPYADRMLGYHPAGQTSNEWFHFDYFATGPDVSDVNQHGFAKWLQAKYVSREAFATAWNQPEINFKAARIPLPQLGLGTGVERSFSTFLDPKSEQNRIDYHEFSSWIVAERVDAICGLIRRETAGRKLVVLFYGYGLELPGVAGGHYAMERMLASPNVDIFASPISYMDRAPGGAASFMTALDSLPLHGKLWLVENDTRTHTLQTDQMTGWMDPAFLSTIYRDPELVGNLVAREYGAMHVHRAGTWWMDLVAGGAFEDPAFWERVGQMYSPLYNALIDAPQAYEPEIAIIFDEQSPFGLRCTDGFEDTQAENYNPAQKRGIHNLRDKLARSGAPVGYYYLGDFLAGRVPGRKVYLFLNLYRTTGTMVETIHNRLAEYHATALWLYGAGWQDASGDGLEAMRRLTGFKLEISAGALGSRSVEGDTLEWGEAVLLDPRFSVEDSDAQPLGVYRDGGSVSLARKAYAGFSSVFIGDIEPSPALLARLYAQAGAHVWSAAASDVLHSDGRLLMLHTATAGKKTIVLPADLQFEASIIGSMCSVHKDVIEIETAAHVTHLILLSKKA